MPFLEKKNNTFAQKWIDGVIKFGYDGYLNLNVKEIINASLNFEQIYSL